MRHTSVRLLSVALVGLQVVFAFPVRGLASKDNEAKSKVSATPPAPAPAVTPAKGAALPAPVLVRPVFSEPPTDEEISRARVLERELAQVGTGTNTEEERLALARAIQLYWNDANLGTKAFDVFARMYRTSVWRASVLTNLGLVYRRTGYWTKALEAFEEAWAIGRQAKTPKDRSEAESALIDCAVSELADLSSRLGRYDRLETLFSEIGSRDVRGSAGNRLNGAREGLWVMDHDPGIAFLCGPFALGNLWRMTNPKKELPQAIKECRSTRQGTSLAMLLGLAKGAGMKVSAARRPAGGGIVVPAVVHWKAGHFAALTREDKNAAGEPMYLLEDPTFGNSYWVTRAALDEEASGYQLISGAAPRDWKTVDAKEAAAVWGKGFTSTVDGSYQGACEYSAAGSAKSSGGCTTCGPKRMAQFDIQTFLVNLHIYDSPVGYTPPRGPAVDLTVTYNQREEFQDYSGYFNFGSLWTHNWMAYVKDDSQSPVTQNVSVYRRGGGVEDVTGGTQSGSQVIYSPQLRSQAIVTNFLDQNGAVIRYERRFPDASLEIYGFTVNPPSGTTRRWFLTALKDPQGNTVTFNYNEAPYNVNSPGVRLTSVIDAISQRTVIDYPTTGTDAERLRVSRVTDPFGRYAQFEYNANGRLQKITDVIGIESSFTYGDADFITGMTTPYGTTAFVNGTTSGTNRSVEVTHPTTEKERVEYNAGNNPATGLPFSETVVPAVPSNWPTYLVNSYTSGRNTFYWDRKAYADYYAPNTSDKFLKAEITHWLHLTYGTLAVGVPESTKSPLENRVWLTYPGQPSGWVLYDGNSSTTLTKPAYVGRVMDDNTTQMTTTTYNSIGKATKVIDPVGRETVYEYSSDGIHLLAVKQRVNATTPAQYETLATYSYNSQHLPLTMTDAAGKTTTYTYNSQGQILTVTNAKNETTTYAYNSDGYLLSVTGAQSGATTTYTYDALGRARTVTDSDGYVVTTSYDNLDRPIRMDYPDGTYREMSYVRPSDSKMTLDVWSVRDRQGRVTSTVYDSLRRVTSVTDPQNRTTIFDWCGCGGLFKMTDARGQETTWNRDVQGRVTSKVLQDGATTNFVYEASTGRLKSVTDPRNQRTNYIYFKDNNVQQVSYTDTAGQPLNPVTPTVTYAYDQFYNRMTSMTDGIGTTNYAYHPVSTTQPGAGQLASVDGPLVNDTISYSYDELGRTLSRSIGSSGNVQTVAYDNLGRTTSVVNALGTFTPSYDGVTGRVLQVLYPNSQKVQMTFDNNLGDRRLLTIHNKDGANATISKFDYTYAPEGNITTWTRQAGSATPQTETFSYDSADQLIGAVLKEGTTTVRQTGYAYDLAGNRTQESLTAGTGFPQTTDYQTIEWDAASRIFAIVKENKRSEFFYDGYGRRVRIVEKENSVIVKDKRYIWSNSEIVEERDSINTGVVRKKYFDLGVNDQGINYYFSKDHLGSIREVVDSNCNLISRFDYDILGKSSQIFGSYKADWGFGGYFFHVPSGLSLTRYRGYDSEVSRWLSRDPIAEKGGFNLFSYVGNNPVLMNDPLGLMGGCTRGACLTEEEKIACRNYYDSYCNSQRQACLHQVASFASIGIAIAIGALLIVVGGPEAAFLIFAAVVVYVAYRTKYCNDQYRDCKSDKYCYCGND